MIIGRSRRGLVRVAIVLILQLYSFNLGVLLDPLVDETPVLDGNS